jgi:hypothetical protein
MRHMACNVIPSCSFNLNPLFPQFLSPLLPWNNGAAGGYSAPTGVSKSARRNQEMEGLEARLQAQVRGNERQELDTDTSNRALCEWQYQR